MSNPNQANINTFLTGTYSANLTTTFTDIVKNPLYSNALIKVKNISFTNFSETLSATVSVRYFNAAFNNNIFINDKFTIAAKSTRQLINNDISINLNEGEFIQANTYSNNSNVNAVVRFDDLSERTDYTGIVASYPFPVNYLVVAGGGGGSGSNADDRGRGGGGAGGFRTGVESVSQTTYVICVGAGGSGYVGGYPGGPGNSGSNSMFSTITSTGGGGGFICGCPGGSGGGGAGNGTIDGCGGLGNTPPTTPSQGNPGGFGKEAPPNYGGGGGGGAGAIGQNGGTTFGGNGGAGCYSTISGSNIAYAGGGGGGAHNVVGGGGLGGVGGGGPGRSNGVTGLSANVNTGGGGGSTGGGPPYTAYTGICGGPGGSGIVIVSYTGQRRAIGGTVTCCAGNTIHTFLSSGNLTFSAFCFFS